MCAYARPFFAAVFGPKHAAAFAAHVVDAARPALITLHHRHDNAWIACAYREANATRLRRQSICQFFPASPPLVLLKIPPTSSPSVTPGPEVKLHGVRCRG